MSDERDTLLATISDALPQTARITLVHQVTEALLASDWLAARDAAVAAQALRDAADEIELPGLDEGDWPRKSSARNNAEGCAEVWLRDRADSLGEAL